jgi:transcriptional regulator with XRE-family HTH domain
MPDDQNINPVLQRLGAQIRTARQKLGISQEKLATDIGASRPSLSGYESGKTPPTIDLVTEIARILGVDFIVDGYVVARHNQAKVYNLPADQLCFEFDVERTFTDATIRIKPSRDTLTITAIVPHTRSGS